MNTVGFWKSLRQNQLIIFNKMEIPFEPTLAVPPIRQKPHSLFHAAYI